MCSGAARPCWLSGAAAWLAAPRRRKGQLQARCPRSRRRTQRGTRRPAATTPAPAPVPATEPPLATAPCNPPAPQIFRTDGTVAEVGPGNYGSDWFEGAIARPGQVLKDFVRAIQPELQKVRRAHPRAGAVPASCRCPRARDATDARGLCAWGGAVAACGRWRAPRPRRTARAVAPCPAPASLPTDPNRSNPPPTHPSIPCDPPCVLTQDLKPTWVRNVFTEKPRVATSAACKSSCEQIKARSVALICPAVRLCAAGQAPALLTASEPSCQYAACGDASALPDTAAAAAPAGTTNGAGAAAPAALLGLALAAAVQLLF